MTKEYKNYLTKEIKTCKKQIIALDAEKAYWEKRLAEAEAEASKTSSSVHRSFLERTSKRSEQSIDFLNRRIAWNKNRVKSLGAELYKARA